jgi:hypothetical protein
MDIGQILNYGSKADNHVLNFIKLYNYCNSCGIVSFSYTYVDVEYLKFMRETNFKVSPIAIADYIKEKISHRSKIPFDSLDITDSEITYYGDKSVHTYYSEREESRKK